jgi:hypothetical protein
MFRAGVSPGAALGPDRNDRRGWPCRMPQGRTAVPASQRRVVCYQPLTKCAAAAITLDRRGRITKLDPNVAPASGGKPPPEPRAGFRSRRSARPGSAASVKVELGMLGTSNVGVKSGISAHLHSPSTRGGLRRAHVTRHETTLWSPAYLARHCSAAGSANRCSTAAVKLGFVDVVGRSGTPVRISSCGGAANPGSSCHWADSGLAGHVVPLASQSGTSYFSRVPTGAGSMGSGRLRGAGHRWG